MIDPEKFTLSNRGLLEIAEHEGVVPAPYLDSVNVWTFGVGHTSGAGAPSSEALPRGMPADMGAALEQVFSVFRTDVAKYERRLREYVKVPLEQHEIDALISFDFNTGHVRYRDNKGRWASSTAVQKLNVGDRAGAAAAFMNWLRPASLRKRRTAERDLFLTGDYDANGSKIPVWRVDERGRLRGVVDELSGAEVLSALGREAPMKTDWLASAPPGAIEWLRRVPV